MAHFYLNIRDGEDLIRDPMAYVFETAQDARDATGWPLTLRADPDITEPPTTEELATLRALASR